MSETIRVNINVSQEVHEFYKLQSQRAGVSMSALMSIALLYYKDVQHQSIVEDRQK